MDAIPQQPPRTSMDDTRDVLASLGLPPSNLWDMPASTKRFPDGAQYRFELPGIQGPDALKGGIAAARERGITLHRITHTIGIMRNTDGELHEMCRIAAAEGLELNLSIGPRATYDLCPSVSTPEGSRIGYRLRGVEQLVRGIEDLKRGLGFGGRCFMLYDEGMLVVANEMRKAGKIPANTHFKISGHMGPSNPASMRLYETLGAGSINPVRDLDIPTWAALRAATDLPLDFSAEAPKSSGGFIRDYDAPEIVRVAAPVYLKCGGFEMATHAFQADGQSVRGYLRRMEMVKRTVETYYGDGVCSGPAPDDLAIPEV